MTEKPVRIGLPGKDGDILVAAAFAYGFADEKGRSFGVGHLAEHCLCESLGKVEGVKEVWGWIDDRTTVINIALDRVAYEKLSHEGFVAVVKRAALATTSADVKREKARIRSELATSYGSITALFTELVRSKIIASPKSLARKRTNQEETIPKLSLADVQAAYEKIFASESRIYVGIPGASDMPFPGKPLAPRLEVDYSNTRSFKAPSDKEWKTFAAAFPAPRLEDGLAESFAVGFLASEVHERFRKVARAEGAYEPCYEHRLASDYAFVWFGLYSASKISDDIEHQLADCIRAAVNAPDLEQRLSAYKKTKAEQISADWADSRERFEWMVEDHIDTGAARGVEGETDELHLLTIDNVRTTSKKYFSPKKAYRFK
jgi:predicted Zn-dependent peptidase